MLRTLRRLRYLSLPLCAVALLAFLGRLGWAHDPTCPHHAGPAAPHAAHASAQEHAAHASAHEHAAQPAHAAHSAHATHARTVEPAPVTPNAHAPADSGQDSGDRDCRCLDPDCCLTGIVAVLNADTGSALEVPATTFDAAPRLMPVSVAPPGAYRTHRLPFPHAPPRIDGLA